MSGGGIMPRAYRELIALAVAFVPGPDGKARGDRQAMFIAALEARKEVILWPAAARDFWVDCCDLYAGNRASLTAAELNAALAVRWPLPPPIPHSPPAPFLSEDH